MRAAQTKPPVLAGVFGRDEAGIIYQQFGIRLFNGFSHKIKPPIKN